MNFLCRPIVVTAICVGTLAFGATAQTGGNGGVHRWERDLRDRLEWEVLWNDSPDSFRFPDHGTATAAIYMTSESLSYCSRDLGVCASYSIQDFHLHDLLRSEPRNSGKDDDAALLSFVGAKSGTPTARQPSRPTRIGPGGITGSLVPGGIRWTSTFSLPGRSEIVQRYKAMHPPELKGLEDWLLATFHRSTGYKSITIACFTPKDPVVYLYGDRPSKGPIVLSVFWDPEIEGWVDANRLAGMRDRAQTLELKGTIDSIACGTVQFE